MLVRLACRGCRTTQSLTIPHGVTPPPNFLCRDCTAGRSMTDGRNVADVKTTELAARVLREGRADNVVESEEESAIDRWKRLNPEWRRVYRQLHRAGYRRPKRTDHPPSSAIIALWYDQVAHFDWRCSECRAELTRETVCCSRSDSGRSFRLEDCVPLCLRCAKCHAANVRWKENRPDAEEYDLYVSEGEKIERCTPIPQS
jgi:hypothetical protein